MWVRSQNKKVLADISKFELVETRFTSYKIIGNGRIDLGTYSNYSRTLEVLEKIQKQLFLGTQSDVIAHDRRRYISNAIFTMPQDGDEE